MGQSSSKDYDIWYEMKWKQPMKDFHVAMLAEMGSRLYNFFQTSCIIALHNVIIIHPATIPITTSLIYVFNFKLKAFTQNYFYTDLPQAVRL